MLFFCFPLDLRRLNCQLLVGYLASKDRFFMNPEEDIPFILDVCKNPELAGELATCFQRSSKHFTTYSEKLRHTIIDFYTNKRFPEQQSQPKGLAMFIARLQHSIRGFVHMTKTNQQIYLPVYNVLIPWVVRAYTC